MDCSSEKIIACDLASGVFECDGKVKCFGLKKGEAVNYENLSDEERSLLCDLVDKENKDLMKAEIVFSGIQERDKFKQEKEMVVEGDCKESMAAGELGKLFEDETQGEKVTLFHCFSQIDENMSDSEDVQKIFQNDGDTIDGIKLIDGSVRRSVKIEVIDDTALIESVFVPKTENDCLKDTRISGPGKMVKRNQKEENKLGVDGKKAKRPRKQANDIKSSSRMSVVLKNLKHIVEDKDDQNNGGDAKIMYSREKMEALRFVKIVEQRKLWTDIYTGLGPAVVNDYDNLASLKNRKQIFMYSNPRPCFSRKSEAAGIISVIAARARRNHFNIYVP